MEHTDPVCGMKVREDTPYRSNHGNQTIYFCSEGCKKEFDENPEDYSVPNE